MHPDIHRLMALQRQQQLLQEAEIGNSHERLLARMRERLPRVRRRERRVFRPARVES